MFTDEAEWCSEYARRLEKELTRLWRDVWQVKCQLEKHHGDQTGRIMVQSLKTQLEFFASYIENEIDQLVKGCAKNYSLLALISDRQNLAQLGFPAEHIPTLIFCAKQRFSLLFDNGKKALQLLYWSKKMGVLEAPSPWFDQFNMRLKQVLRTLAANCFVVIVHPSIFIRKDSSFAPEIYLIGEDLDVGTVTATMRQSNDTGSTGKEVKRTLKENVQRFSTKSGEIKAIFKKLKIGEMEPRRTGSGDVPATAITKYVVDFTGTVKLKIEGLSGGSIYSDTVIAQASSLPFLVVVNSSQNCKSEGAIVFHRAAICSLNDFSSLENVSWNCMSQILRYKFMTDTGTSKLLTDADLDYFALKVLQGNPYLTYEMFAVNKMADSDLAFWTWLWNIFKLFDDKRGVRDFWNQGWCIGFISKQDAVQILFNQPRFLIRFSETQESALSISAFTDEEVEHFGPFYLSWLDFQPLPLVLHTLKDVGADKKVVTKDGQDGASKAEIIAMCESVIQAGERHVVGYKSVEMELVSDRTSSRAPSTVSTIASPPLNPSPPQVAEAQFYPQNTVPPCPQQFGEPYYPPEYYPPADWHNGISNDVYMTYPME